MEKKVYKRISDEDKVKALKRHLLEKVPVSSVCDELGIAPSLFYTWQHRLFESAASAFMRSGKSAKEAPEKRRIDVLEERLRVREEALAELVTELMTIKKRSSGGA